MASIIYRVSGRPKTPTKEGTETSTPSVATGKSKKPKVIARRFTTDKEAQKAMRAFKETLEDPKTTYEVRLRVDRQVSRTFDHIGEARRWARKIEAAKDDGVAIDPRKGKAPIRDIGKRWLASNPLKRQSSLQRDRAILVNHVYPAIGNRQIGRVTLSDVQALVDGWALTQAKSTVGRQYTTIRALFSWAVKNDIIGRTPCRDIRVPTAPKVKRPQPTPVELHALAEALGADDAPMMWLAAVAGFRWAECAGLTVDCLDLLNGTVEIKQQLLRDGSLGEPKSDSSARTVSIPTWLVDDIAAVLHRRHLTAADRDALVFTSSEGRPLHYVNWRRRTWCPAREAAGLPSLGFHDLRSLNTTILIAGGVDVKTVQTRLGHSSPEVTLGIYARMTADADKNAAKVVGKHFRPRENCEKNSGASRGSRRTSR